MTAVPANAAAFIGVAVGLLSAAYLITLMFSMGLELGAEHEDKQAKRRQHRLIARALAFNLLVLPIIAVALTRWLRASSVVETALLVLAATPGGRFAPHLARLARADRALSVEIALFLFKLVPFTAPFAYKWMLGVQRVDLHDLPFIVKLLALQLLPYLRGSGCGAIGAASPIG